VHPDLLQALAKAQHADLLRDHEFRRSKADRLAGHVRWPSTSIGWIRRTVGAALVSAGTRLLRDGVTLSRMGPVGHPTERAGS
jgi:hypothetical protein